MMDMLDGVVKEQVKVAWGIRSTDAWVMSNINDYVYLDPKMTKEEVEQFAKAYLNIPLGRELTDNQHKNGWSYCEIREIVQEYVRRDDALKRLPMLQRIADAKNELEKLENEYKKEK